MTIEDVSGISYLALHLRGIISPRPPTPVSSRPGPPKSFDAKTELVETPGGLRPLLVAKGIWGRKSNAQAVKLLKGVSFDTRTYM